ncbi:MAG: tetratricopeptide repeat protein [Spirulinaceae cyanobacterium]
MTQARSLWQRILVILGGVAFLGGTVLTSLSFLGGDRSTQGSSGDPTEATDTAPSEEQQQQLVEMEEGYLAVLEREPENFTALQGLVQARVGMGNLEEALEPLEKLNELSPDDPQVLQAIAAINSELGQFPEALAFLEQLNEVSPEDPEILQAIAGIHIRLEQIPEAIETLDALEKLNEVNPDDPQILQAIATINIQLQQFPEAIGPLEELAALQPENEELQEQIAALKQIIETGEVPTIPAPNDANETAPTPETDSTQPEP